jgi:hypothetical protein
VIRLAHPLPKQYLEGYTPLETAGIFGWDLVEADSTGAPIVIGAPVPGIVTRSGSAPSGVSKRAARRAKGGDQ